MFDRLIGIVAKSFAYQIDKINKKRTWQQTIIQSALRLICPARSQIALFYLAGNRNL